MKLETKLKQLVVQLPAKQQMLDFSNDNHWQGLPGDDQQSCRQAIVDLLLHVVLLERDENDNESSNRIWEGNEDE